MRVAVEVGFVQSCPDCRSIVAGLASSCINDATVTAFRAIPGSKHAHEVTEGAAALPGLSSAQPEPLPTSDTNGYMGEQGEAAIFSETEMAFATATSEPGRVNGFDTNRR